jgi:chromosome partitioning protein
MTYVVSTINLKGGVGKTTTTVALAEFLSGEFGKKVLVVDLDPQTNATTVLIGEKRWEKLNAAGHTLATLFQDAMRPESDPEKFDIDKTLQCQVSPVSAVGTVDLLPSSLDLIDVQDRLASMPSGRFYASRPVDLLHKKVKPLLKDYDYVLVDCPPNLGIITLNGLRISQGYIIPTIPDVLSTYGIPQIQKRVADFAADIGDDIVELGIVVSKYRTGTTVHENTLARMQADVVSGKLPSIFEAMIPEANQAAAAAEHVKVSTLRQKYGYAGLFPIFEELTQEFVERCEEEL